MQTLIVVYSKFHGSRGWEMFSCWFIEEQRVKLRLIIQKHCIGSHIGHEASSHRGSAIIVHVADFAVTHLSHEVKFVR
jgi:hypothetical protein